MEGYVIFRHREGNGFMNRCNPLVKLSALIVLSSLLSFATPLFIMVFFIFLAFLSLAIRLPWRSLIAGCTFFLILAAFIFVTDLMDERSALEAAASALKFLSVLIMSLIFTDTTSPNDTARSISAFLYPVFRKGAVTFGFIVELTLSMIPTVLETMVGIKDARASRGEVMLRHPVRALTGLSISLFSALLDNISSYADALEGRLYSDEVRREAPGFTYRDLIMVLIIAAISGVIIWTR